MNGFVFVFDAKNILRSDWTDLESTTNKIRNEFTGVLMFAVVTKVDQISKIFEAYEYDKNDDDIKEFFSCPEPRDPKPLLVKLLRKKFLPDIKENFVFVVSNYTKVDGRNSSNLEREITHLEFLKTAIANCKPMSQRLTNLRYPGFPLYFSTFLASFFCNLLVMLPLLNRLQY